jgi:hypothetical protein
MIFYDCPVRIFQYLSESIGIYCHIAINVVVGVVAFYDADLVACLAVRDCKRVAYTRAVTVLSTR